jgi:hypothetical protein
MNHTARPGTWKCEQCGNIFCDECLGVKVYGDMPNKGCLSCGAMCLKYELNQKSIGPVSYSSESFFPLLMSSFVYPLRGKGLVILVAGTILMFLFMIAIGIISFVSPGMALMFLLLAVSYPCAFFMMIIEDSARGYDQPDWPDVSSFIEGMVIPFGKFIGTFLISFLPLIAYIVYYIQRTPQTMMEKMGEIDPNTMTPEMMEDMMTRSGPSETLITVLAVLGLIYWPMSLLSAALGYGHVFNPIQIFGSIFKVFLHYALAFLFILIAGAVIGKGQELLGAHLGIFALFLIPLMSFYLVILEMRVLGIIYYANRHKLDW